MQELVSPMLANPRKMISWRMRVRLGELASGETVHCGASAGVGSRMLQTSAIERLTGGSAISGFRVGPLSPPAC